MQNFSLKEKNILKKMMIKLKEILLKDKRKLSKKKDNILTLEVYNKFKNYNIWIVLLVDRHGHVIHNAMAAELLQTFPKLPRGPSRALPRVPPDLPKAPPGRPRDLPDLLIKLKSHTSTLSDSEEIIAIEGNVVKD